MNMSNFQRLVYESIYEINPPTEVKRTIKTFNNHLHQGIFDKLHKSFDKEPISIYATYTSFDFKSPEEVEDLEEFKAGLNERCTLSQADKALGINVDQEFDRLILHMGVAVPFIDNTYDQKAIDECVDSFRTIIEMTVKEDYTRFNPELMTFFGSYKRVADSVMDTAYFAEQRKSESTQEIQDD